MEGVQRYTNKFDLQPYFKGTSKVLGINSQTVQNITEEVVMRTKLTKHAVKFRGYKRLGYIPFKGQTVTLAGSQFIYKHGKQTKYIKIWKHRELPEGSQIRSGSITQDSLGKWFLNLVLKVPKQIQCPKPIQAVGIDLGLKTTATLSSGEGFSTRRLKELEHKLASAQRANKKRLAKSIHKKIANRRKDDLHKFTHKLASKTQLIVVGDVSSQWMTKTRMAKSAADNSWGVLKRMLEYKANRHDSVFKIVNEAYTTKTCSTCGWLDSSNQIFKKGPVGLSVRNWKCPSCGSDHDRDHNAAINILKIGLGKETL